MILCGRDLEVVTIDFESYWDTDYRLNKPTTEAYVRDPRFETIIASVRRPDGRATWMEASQFQRWAEDWDWSRTAILAHHTQFDGLVAAHHYGIRPAFWLDTMSMARALHPEAGGALKDLMPYYGVGEKGLEIHKTKGKHLADFTPDELKAYGDYSLTDALGCWGIFAKMMARGFPEKELHLIDWTIRAFVNPVLRIDEAKIQALITDEQRRKTELLERIGADRETLMSNDRFAALLESMGEPCPRKVSKKKSEKAGQTVTIPAVAKSDPEFQALLEHEREDIRHVAEARLGIKSTGNETRAGRLLACNQRGPLTVYLKYYGAHTGRYSGGDRTNWQNFERCDRKRPEKGRVRKAVIPPPGHVIVVRDSGQIEARVTAWLAGHSSLISDFQAGRDVYSAFASEIYNRVVTKADERERHVGKSSVLGLGFGMGWLRFASEMLKGAQGGDPVQFTMADAENLGVDLATFEAMFGNKVEGMVSRISYTERLVHCAVASAIVDRYREINAPIPKFWRFCERALRAMMNGQEMQFGPGGMLKTQRNRILLPNGMALRYPGLNHDGDGFYYRSGPKGRKRVDTWGGTITENLAQALARIIVTDQLLDIDARYHVATMTHDEILAVVPEAEGPAALEFMGEVMGRSPSWAQGLPVKSEGGIGYTYGDAK